MAARITGVVNTLNAEGTLEFALRSLRPWVDDMVVVDMHSDDRTREIADEMGARVLLHERVGYVEPARRFALEQATGDWVMVLDADEVVPPALARRLRAIADDDVADVVVIPWRNFFFGREVRYGTFSPTWDYHARFLRRDAVTWPEDIHAVPVPRENARRCRLDPAEDGGVLHFAYRDVAEFVAKTNRYTDVELTRPGPLAASPRRVLRTAAITFLRSYVRRGGYKDGWVGLHTSTMLACYQLIAAAKAAQLANVGDAAAAERRYRQIAEQVLAEYDPAP